MHSRPWWFAVVPLLWSCEAMKPPDPPAFAMAEFHGAGFAFGAVSGLGTEGGAYRLDPSDVIRVSKTYFIYYTKVRGTPLRYGGTIFCATSTDEGRTWTEEGEVLGLGPDGGFDARAVYAPNVLYRDKRYWMFYTGLCAARAGTKVEVAAIGLAVADSPIGPFARVSTSPVLAPSPIASSFDSYRVEDPALLVRGNRVLLYYRGRSLTIGPRGRELTGMGLATAARVEGPYVRENDGEPVLTRTGDVLIWPHRRGVAAIASISGTIQFAKDGVSFAKEGLDRRVDDPPVAAGAFRPDLTKPVDYGNGIQWGVSTRNPIADPRLSRFEIDLVPRD